MGDDSLAPATMSIHPPGAGQHGRLGLAAAALWVLPLWVAPFPPMVDYPQQLALAAILRWYGDPARRFREAYELALWAPHGLFQLLVAGLAWALPINVAGRLVVSLSLVAVGAAALALCRRAGRPAVYALLALSLTYNYAFFWGFVDNLLAYPLALGGLALADGLFDRPFTARSWLALAGVGILFYTIHLQFLLLFAGAVGWIAICRLPGWRRLALWLSALVPGLAVAAASRRDSLESLLFRARFATLAGWLAVLYLVSPEFRGGYLIAQRIAPFAAMVAVTALPVPRPDRRRLVAWAAAAMVVFQFGQTLEGFLRFRTESEGLGALLATTEPGQNLAGLTFERSSASWPGMPVYLHFPAYYQVYKGGRILFSFAELFQTSARFRPGRSWDDLLAEWNEWSPQLFDWDRHAGRFRYFLVRGSADDVAEAFGDDPSGLGLSLRMAGRWWLFERETETPAAKFPVPCP